MLDSSEQIDELAKALVKAQGEFESVDKTADNPFFKSTYAPLPAVVKAATPILAKHGLAVIQTLGYVLDEDTLTTRLIHESGQWVEDMMRLHLTKKDSQGLGSATTYARRYSYMAILGLVADEDDDGNKASPRATTNKPTTTKRAAPKQAAAPKSEGAFRKLFAMNDRNGNKVVPTDPTARHAWATGILGKSVESFSDLEPEDIVLLEKAAKEQAIHSTPAYSSDDPERPF